MAFPAAVGHSNLPNGNFSPVIYSKKVQLALRKQAIAEALFGSAYFGEIANAGDSVRIIKEPSIVIQDYARGAQLTSQDIIDEDFTLVIDQSNAFQFRIDDIEKKHSHVDFEPLAISAAAYALSDHMDQNLLAYISGYRQSALQVVGDTLGTSADIPGTKAISTAADNELLTSMQLNKGMFNNITTASAGDHSIPLAVRLPGATAVSTSTATPLQVIQRMGRVLDQQNVPRTGRKLVIDPVFQELLLSEDSRLVDADFGGGTELRNGLLWPNLYGFSVHVSNNLPSVGTGPETSGTSNQNSNYGVIVAVHDSAAAFAQQISKTETFRDPFSFADVVRGMNLWGRKILRPEAITTAKYNVA